MARWHDWDLGVAKEDGVGMELYLYYTFRLWPFGGDGMGIICFDVFELWTGWRIRALG